MKETNIPSFESKIRSFDGKISMASTGDVAYLNKILRKALDHFGYNEPAQFMKIPSHDWIDYSLQIGDQQIARYGVYDGKKTLGPMAVNMISGAIIYLLFKELGPEAVYPELEDIEKRLNDRWSYQ